mgnify:CR=1 FL=1
MVKAIPLKWFYHGNPQLENSLNVLVEDVYVAGNVATHQPSLCWPLHDRSKLADNLIVEPPFLNIGATLSLGFTLPKPHHHFPIILPPTLVMFQQTYA